MGDPVRINGKMHSWGSIIAKVNGDRFTGFNSVGYGDKLEMVYGYGMNRSHAPRGRSSGKYTIEPLKLGGSLSSFQYLRQALAMFAPDQKSYGLVEFEVNVQYIEVGDLPMNVSIHGVRWQTESSAHEESPDPLKAEAEFSPMWISRNGLTLFDSSLGVP